MTDITIRSQQDLAPATQAADIMTVIARAAADPSMDVAKMQALLDMQERLMKRQAEVEFKAAKARIQPGLPTINKAGRIEVQGQIRSRFARYEDIHSALKPLLAGEGFTQSFNTEDVSGKVRISLTVSHHLGHSETVSLLLPVDTQGAKSPLQGVGSTYTFGKRYLVINYWDIKTTDDPMDDDGAAYAPITDEQASKLVDMLVHLNADQQKFCAVMGVSDISKIPVSEFPRAMELLRRKAGRRS